MGRAVAALVHREPPLLLAVGVVGELPVGIEGVDQPAGEGGQHAGVEDTGLVGEVRLDGEVVFGPDGGGQRGDRAPDQPGVGRRHRALPDGGGQRLVDRGQRLAGQATPRAEVGRGGDACTCLGGRDAQGVPEQDRGGARPHVGGDPAAVDLGDGGVVDRGQPPAPGLEGLQRGEEVGARERGPVEFLQVVDHRREPREHVARDARRP